MKKNLLFFLLTVCTFQLFSQSKNVTLLGNKPYTKSLSDIWGYVDPQGKEYALVGVYNGTSIVDVSNPANPVEKFFIPGPNSTWRDLKVWDKHLYVTNETSGGVTIIDMTYLPDSISTTTWTGNNGVNFTKAHNIWIDEKGFAYIFGSNYGAGGAIIADLNQNPKVPQVVSVYNVAYIHDGYVRNDTMWTAEINIGRFAIVDVSDKSSATIGQSKIMGFTNTPSNFTHNIWPSDDGKYVFTTDEKSNAYIGAYDISDVTDIIEVDRIRSRPGSGVIPHNVFYHNNFLVTAYYRDGITIMDATDPSNIILTGYYDTSPLSGNGFNGAWGVYPYLPSGNIIASDIENGLFILSANYNKAARIEGSITDAFTNNPINDAVIEIVGQSINEKTDLNGLYKSGLADAGTYSIKVSKYGYFDTLITGVQLQNGNTTILDIALIPENAFVVQVEVRDLSTNQLIPNAAIQIKNNNYNNTGTLSSGTGSYSLQQDNFTFYAAKWGYKPTVYDTAIINGNTPIILFLEKGYYDDFVLDLGWQVSGNAVTGSWEKGKPNGTFLNSVPSNPIADIPTDFGDNAYVTGNKLTTQAGDDDVDNGYTILTSPPMDLTVFNNPEISYYRWFVNSGGSGNPNDSLVVRISNGDSTVVVDRIKGGDLNQSIWFEQTIVVKDFIGLSNNMTISFTASDEDPGHIVEAGIDGFVVAEGINTNVSTPDNSTATINIYPNPFDSQFTVEYSFEDNTTVKKLMIFDITGKLVKEQNLNSQENQLIIADINQPGVYFVRIVTDNQEFLSKQIIKIK